MKTKVNTKISWSPKELKALVANEHSSVCLEQIKKHISLHPIHLNNINEALHEILDESINFYDPQLKGYILSYTNPELLDAVGLMLYDAPFIHVNIQANFYVFRPEVGCKLSGKVNKRAKNHIGVLVHKIFNVWIPQSEDEDSWEGKDFKVGQNVEFTVTHVNVRGKLPDIRGKLLPSQVQKTSRKSESLTKSAKNQHTTFNDDGEEEERTSEAEDSAKTQKKVVTSTPKPGNKHAIFADNSDSSSDEDSTPRQSVKSTKNAKILVNGSARKTKFSSPSKSGESEDNDHAESPGDNSILRQLKKRDVSESPERETEAWPQEMIDSPRKSRLLEAGVLTQVESTKSQAKKTPNKSNKQTIFSYETSSDEDMSNDDSEVKTKPEPSIKRKKTHSSPKMPSIKQAIFSAANSDSSSDEEQTKSKKLNHKTAPTPQKINPPTSGNSSDDNRVTDNKINRKKTSHNSKSSKKAKESNPPSDSDSSSDEEDTPFPKRKKRSSVNDLGNTPIKKEFSPTKTSLARQLRPSSSDDSSDENDLAGEKSKSISAVKKRQSRSSNDNFNGLKIKKELSPDEEQTKSKKLNYKTAPTPQKVNSPTSGNSSDDNRVTDNKINRKKTSPKKKNSSVRFEDSKSSKKAKQSNPPSDSDSSSNEDGTPFPKRKKPSSDNDLSNIQIKKEFSPTKTSFARQLRPSSSDDSSDENDLAGEKLKSMSAVKKRQSRSSIDNLNGLKIKKELSPEKATPRAGKINPPSSSDDSSDEDNTTRRKSKQLQPIPVAKNHQRDSFDDNWMCLKIKKEPLSEKTTPPAEKINPQSGSTDLDEHSSTSKKLNQKKSHPKIKKEPLSEEASPRAEKMNPPSSPEPRAKKSMKRKSVNIKIEPNTSDAEGPSAKKKIRSTFSE